MKYLFYSLYEEESTGPATMNDWSAPVRAGSNSQSPEGVTVARDCRADFIARRLWHSRRLGSDKTAT